MNIDVKPAKEPLKIFGAETFKEIKLETELKFRYAVSNFGRIISFTDKFEDGRLIKGTMTEGYRIFRYRIRQNNKIKHKYKFFYRLVAENFLEKTSDEQTNVLHLDHNLSNDVVGNLKWATKKEMVQHHQTSPKVKKSKIESKRRLIQYNRNREGYKLSTTKVMLIKKLLAKPDRTTKLKIIARQFGISEMQLYRIRTGENWKRVVV